MGSAPVETRRWNPDCCGCGENTPVQALVDLSAAQEPLPAWCQYVPQEFRTMACQGNGRSCKCEETCNSTSVESRRWNPECCGCAESAPVQALVDLSAAAQGPVPAWCQYVPQQYRTVACHGNGRSCTCKETCRSA